MKRLILAFTAILMVHISAAQTGNFYPQMARNDISAQIMPDKVFYEYERWGERPEPLGYIGEDFQRFYIHFISIIQNGANPYEYLVYGKTRVKGTICPFQGTITLRKAEKQHWDDYPNNIDAVNCIFDVVLYEDSKFASTGIMKGTLHTDFTIDSRGKILYDAAQSYADGFYNNQFEGRWTSYKTGASKVLCWGDYRIPNSRDLDIGAGEFSPHPTYYNNGWQNYEFHYNNDALFQQKEGEQWWR